MSRSVVLFLLFSWALRAESGPIFLRAVRFEPKGTQAAPKVIPGATIDARGADSTAASVRTQLVNEGYRDAKVQAALVSVGYREADLHIKVERGEQYRVEDVRFTGNPGLDVKKLRRVFHHIPYSDPSVQSALARARSLYVASGHFNAEVRVADTEIDKSRVTLTLDARPGSQYGPFSAKDTCRCVFEALRRSEHEGVVEFRPHLEIEEGGKEVRPIFDEGPPYTVGRINFRGNHSYGDLTLRRALVLNEGALFDGDLLRRSVSRLNRLGLFEPLSGKDVEIRQDAAARRADVIFHMHEKGRGRWSFSGPVVPVGVTGPFTASITSRLPAWGRGVLEASTYYATFQLIALTPAVARLIPFVPKSGILPLATLERPFLPGQTWTSGFTISPQLGWKAAIAGYAVGRAHEGFRSLLGGDRMNPPSLMVPLEWTSPERPAKAGALICDPPKPRWSKVRTVAAMLNEFLLGVRPF